MKMGYFIIRINFKHLFCKLNSRILILLKSRGLRSLWRIAMRSGRWYGTEFFALGASSSIYGYAWCDTTTKCNVKKGKKVALCCCVGRGEDSPGETRLGEDTVHCNVMKSFHNKHICGRKVSRWRPQSLIVGFLEQGIYSHFVGKYQTML
jgi:hypothetical protein